MKKTPKTKAKKMHYEGSPKDMKADAKMAKMPMAMMKKPRSK